MKLKKTLVIITICLMLGVPILAQDTGAAGFIISLKNGSSVRGRTLSRDDATGKLRLAMTEDASGEAKELRGHRARRHRRNSFIRDRQRLDSNKTQGRKRSEM